MTKIEKVLYTGKTHTMGGRDGVTRSDYAQLDPPSGDKPRTIATDPLRSRKARSDGLRSAVRLETAATRTTIGKKALRTSPA